MEMSTNGVNGKNGHHRPLFQLPRLKRFPVRVVAERPPGGYQFVGEIEVYASDGDAARRVARTALFEYPDVRHVLDIEERDGVVRALVEMEDGE